MAERGSRVDDKREPGFIIVDNEILEVYGQRIKPQGIALYCALTLFARNTTRECWPSVSTLANRTGMSKKTVQRYAKLLQEVGLITVEYAEYENGRYSSNVYTLLPVKKQKQASKKPIIRDTVRESHTPQGVPSESRGGYRQRVARTRLIEPD